MPLQVQKLVRMTQISGKHHVYNDYCNIKVTNKQPDRAILRAARSRSILGAERPYPLWACHAPAHQYVYQLGRFVGLTVECYCLGFITLP